MHFIEVVIMGVFTPRFWGIVGLTLVARGVIVLLRSARLKRADPTYSGQGAQGNLAGLRRTFLNPLSATYGPWGIRE